MATRLGDLVPISGHVMTSLLRSKSRSKSGAAADQTDGPSLPSGLSSTATVAQKAKPIPPARDRQPGVSKTAAGWEKNSRGLAFPFQCAATAVIGTLLSTHTQANELFRATRKEATF